LSAVDDGARLPAVLCKDIVRAFRRRWVARHGVRPASQFGRCLETSEAFAELARTNGSHAEILQARGLRRVRAFPRMDTRWRAIPAHLIEHHVVQLGRYVVDWTARQFDPTAPVPEITPVAVFRRRWRSIGRLTL